MSRKQSPAIPDFATECDSETLQTVEFVCGCCAKQSPVDIEDRRSSYSYGYSRGHTRYVESNVRSGFIGLGPVCRCCADSIRTSANRKRLGESAFYGSGGACGTIPSWNKPLRKYIAAVESGKLPAPYRVVKLELPLPCAA